MPHPGPNRRQILVLSTHTSTCNAIQNDSLALWVEGQGLKSSAQNPFSNSYHPEMDTTEGSNANVSTWFLYFLEYLVGLLNLDFLISTMKYSYVPNVSITGIWTP